MTYNVHRCVGTDRKLAPERVAEVIATYAPDVVALQELDVGRARTRFGDQPDLIAKILKMEFHFHPSIRIQEERFGNAVLSRLPLRCVKGGGLPTPVSTRRIEGRSALWVTIDCGGREVQLINTHLGLRPGERMRQLDALFGPDWLGDERCRTPRILLGDFNAWPTTRVYRRLLAALTAAQRARPRAWPRTTFPSRMPVLRIDHVFVSPEWTVEAVDVPRTRLTRLASDHLPVIVEVSLP
jgi:endonuclease/exonuclease/phosphatase family metal-dependent hydrolase